MSLFIELRRITSRASARFRRAPDWLRAYLAAMTLMLGYHVLDLAGAFHALK